MVSRELKVAEKMSLSGLSLLHVARVLGEGAQSDMAVCPLVELTKGLMETLRAEAGGASPPSAVRRKKQEEETGKAETGDEEETGEEETVKQPPWRQKQPS